MHPKLPAILNLILNNKENTIVILLLVIVFLLFFIFISIARSLKNKKKYTREIEKSMKAITFLTKATYSTSLKEFSEEMQEKNKKALQDLQNAAAENFSTFEIGLITLSNSMDNLITAFSKNEEIIEKLTEKNIELEKDLLENLSEIFRRKRRENVLREKIRKREK